MCGGEYLCRTKQKFMDGKRTARGITATVCGGIMWGFSGACGQYIFQRGITAQYLAPLRMIFSGIILLLLSITWQRKQFLSLVRDKKALIRAAVFGVFGIITSQFCYLAAISYSNAGTATVLQYLGPVIIMAYTCISAKRLPTAAESVCLLLAVLGTFLIASHGRTDELAISPKALFWGLASAVGLALYSIIPEKIIPKYGAVSVSAIGMTCGGIVLMAALRPYNAAAAWDLHMVLAFLAIVIVGTVFAYTLFLHGVGLIGASKASIVSCVEPVSAAVISFFWLKSTFEAADIVGFALIIETVIIIAVQKKQA